MPPASNAARDLEARLSEIDDTLRLIQSELAPDREPRPSRPTALAAVVADAPVAPDALLASDGLVAPAARPAGVPGAVDPHAKLLAAMHELLDAYTIVVGQLDRAPTA